MTGQNDLSDKQLKGRKQSRKSDGAQKKTKERQELREREHTPYRTTRSEGPGEEGVPDSPKGKPSQRAKKKRCGVGTGKLW